MTETAFLVYSWDEGELSFARRVFVRTRIGEQVTAERLCEWMVDNDLHAFTSGKYRAFPESSMIDFEVKSELVLS